MKKYLIFLFAIALTNLINAQRSYNLSGFNSIAATCAADVTIKQGDFSVSATGSDEALKKLEIVVDGQSLKIKTKKGTKGWSNNKGSKPVRVTVSLPELKALAISGSGDVEMSGDWNTEKFAVTVSGSGDLNSRGSVTTKSLAIVVSGSGDLGLGGSSNKVAITCSGSGDADLENWKTKSAAIVNSGSADIEIHASGEVSIVNSGSGDIEIKGNPEKKSIVNTGSGDIDYK